MDTVIKAKHIVLGVCGGIAAYKSVELLRLLVKQGAQVRVIMTKNARQFVGPLTFEALSGRKVCDDLFDAGEDAAIGHIKWAEEADAVVIAPATANMIGKLANGIADDALSTFMMAVTCRSLICPAMNANMYASGPVQRNLKRLNADGHIVIDPEAGELACGTTGPGRLPEPVYIHDRIIHALSPKDLNAANVLVTAGPTREAIDPVRFVGNHSSGKMGYAIARAAEMRGAHVTLISGPSALPPPVNVQLIRVTSAAEMADAVFENFETADVLIKSAAVADYRPSQMENHKIKKSADARSLNLERTIDILTAVSKKKTHQLVVGFAAETRDLDDCATKKLQAKHLDMIVGNLVNAEGSGFEVDTNRANLYYKDGSRETLQLMPKSELADLILDRVVAMMRK
ncbi:MAG: bifunctional phosphopantothenoylcysteine decarboxylase/phosphopantothenate--cysteine ligase CoaBC [Desulfobacteraceae bacterium]|jgi:phosphopantothenoylcysteine decarboxylase/phosphopantothenate--cysteine ligase